MIISENKFNIGDELFFIGDRGVRKGRVCSIEFYKKVYPKSKKNYERWSYEFKYNDGFFHPYLIDERLCAKDTETLSKILSEELINK